MNVIAGFFQDREHLALISRYFASKQGIFTRLATNRRRFNINFLLLLAIICPLQLRPDTLQNDLFGSAIRTNQWHSFLIRSV
jgi:hypothetical protein